jgi:hypothetical protein
LSVSIPSPPDETGSFLGAEWPPDIEKIEPLCRVLARDSLQGRNPGVRGLFLLAALDGERLGYSYYVTMTRVEETERG